MCGALTARPDPSFRALSGRLKFTVRRHKFNRDSLFSRQARRPPQGGHHLPRDRSWTPACLRRRGTASSGSSRLSLGLVCKAHRHFYHSTLGLRVIKKKKRRRRDAQGRLEWLVQVMSPTYICFCSCSCSSSSSSSLVSAMCMHAQRPC